MTELLTIDLFFLLGGVCAVVVFTMVLLTLLVLPMRLAAQLVAAARWLARTAGRHLHRHALDGKPWRPLSVRGLSTPLSRVIQQTRTLALELRRASAETADWPAESAPELSPSGWRESLLGTEANAPLTAIRSDVFAWIGLVETLPSADREVLAGLGVDVEAVRHAMTGECAPAEVVRALAGLLWSIDERLSAAGGFGYRASGVERAAGTGVSAGPWTNANASASEDEEQTRRGRWAGTVAEHGAGLSRMAASYTRGAEREDLEQDIALALWRALPLFRGESSLKTFAYRVARYCCFRHIRRRKEADATLDPAGLADPSTCIESAILHAEQRAQIEQALTELPDNLESVLTLHLTGHSYAQIAETLGITERNVSVRLSRARARLRRQLVAA
ncbi:sigma-70 family RNA polymerase sigma factor [Nannocystis radixulma]|uniref:Sigma-70 family RNA polymerase sigma factor n=1 Tax=Nannocystis radixulma TaxID=2995305 RepID=A0ABT5BEK7_9BACT|nr:sigma-70 family RNA polymerase sigma factor [Nannocystis radixulma]MDC0672579.1 sigma-70 family RNA polymerase sigma factor [Nannocystis radixulma]